MDFVEVLKNIGGVAYGVLLVYLIRYTYHILGGEWVAVIQISWIR